MNKNINELKLYKRMLRIRIAEERIAEIYPLGEMRTPVHFSIGQEAVSVGVCAALRKDDAVFASHRCHAAYLAKGGDMRGMVAELYGRVTGALKGKSGSAHLASPRDNMYAAPILGCMIPVAVGMALSFFMREDHRVAAVFLGDAALEEGVFTESVNFAVVKKLPVLFVCENNLFSTHTHIRYRQPARAIYKRAAGLGIESARTDGNDCAALYARVKRIIEPMRRKPAPAFLECMTYRYREHVGPRIDYDNPYRTREELEGWMRRCPIKRLERRLMRMKVLNVETREAIRRKIILEVEDAIEYARKSPWPRHKDLLENVYQEKKP